MVPGDFTVSKKYNCKQKYLKNIFFHWIVIGFGLDCQSILKSGFGFGLSIINLQRIWIGLPIRKKWIEQYPGWGHRMKFNIVTATSYLTSYFNKAAQMR